MPESPRTREVNRDVPKEVSRLIDRLLAKSPGLRIQTAETAERELVQLLSDLQKRGVSIRNRNDALGVKQYCRQASQFLKRNLSVVQRKSVAIGTVISLAAALTLVCMVSLRDWLNSNGTRNSTAAWTTFCEWV